MTQPVESGPDGRLPNTADLVLLAPDCDGRAWVVLIVRAKGPTWGGEVALPGGHINTGEAPAQAALREAVEEVGVPAERVKFLEDLPHMPTKTTGKLIAPFLARLDGPFAQWSPQTGEVDEVVEIPADAFVDPSSLCSADGDCFFRVTAKNGRVCDIRGATYRILRPLAERLAAMNLR